MRLTVMQEVLWAVPFGLHLILLGILFFRRRWRAFPVLTSWIAFQIVRTMVLFFLYRHGIRREYMDVYTVLLFGDYALQLGIVFEIARTVLRPTGTWLRDAAWQLGAVALAALVVAGVFAWLISPPMRDPLLRWLTRANLLTSLLMCELFVAMNFTSRRLGLGWRSHVMAIAQALTAWATVMLIGNALQSYLGNRLFTDFDNLRAAAYVLAVGWISVQLWNDEPERQPLSPELQAYIVALHQRVEYDLRRIDA